MSPEERTHIGKWFNKYQEVFGELVTRPSMRKRKVHSLVLMAECVNHLNKIYVYIRRRTQARGMHFRYWDKPSSLDDALEELDRYDKRNKENR